MSRGDNGIPINIVEDILYRLPSKTVLRFKIASKTWYALISDPMFIIGYSKRVSPNPKILLSTTNTSKFLRSELKILTHDLQFEGPFNFPKEESPVQPYKIIGSSFGLVCIATDYCGNFYIWNPTTRESRKIPNFGSEQIKHYEYLHGMSYDLVANDFKVVISLYPIEYTKKLTVFNVFSLKTNSWKKIVSPFRYFYNPSKYPSDWQFPSANYGETKSQFENYVETTSATVLNGVFHWIVRVPNEIDPQIIAFDSRKETFYKLQIPKEKFHKLLSSQFSLCLFEHDKCLCLLCYNDEYRHIIMHEIWMMKEYSNHKSWIHLHNIYGIDLRKICRPISITQNIKLQLRTGDHIKICRQKTKMEVTKWSGSGEERKYVNVWNFDVVRYSDVAHLVSKSIFGAALVDETLISPHDFAQESECISEFDYFSRDFNIFRTVVNVFMNLWRDLSYLFRDFE